MADVNSTCSRVSIIILDWNGKEDTLACFESLSRVDYPDFDIVLVDNGSGDGCAEAVRKEFSGKLSFHIIENNENLGFARANNIGIGHAICQGADYILLLNNDTVVSTGFLQELTAFLDQHVEYGVVCPQIRYFGRDEAIWNCGGRLTRMGFKKYFFEGRNPESLSGISCLDITFITGCALMARASVFKEFGLLTEDFFFGEEDYEFSMRMREKGVRMACLMRSVIWHKVGTSVSRASDQVTGKVFVNNLNHFVNLKRYFPKWKWRWWRLGSLVYVLLVLLLKYHVSPGRLKRFSRTLLRESSRLNRVDKLTFEKYFSCNFSKAMEGA